MIFVSFAGLASLTSICLLSESLFEFVSTKSTLLFNSTLLSEELLVNLFNSSCASLINSLASSGVTSFLRLSIGAVINLPASV